MLFCLQAARNSQVSAGALPLPPGARRLRSVAQLAPAASHRGVPGSMER
jgi:hypothetical protein